MKDEPLATIEFPHGERIYLGQDRRWHGADPDYVRITNSLMDKLPEEKRDNWAYSVAHELAAESGAKVIQFVKLERAPRLSGPDS